MGRFRCFTKGIVRSQKWGTHMWCLERECITKISGRSPSGDQDHSSWSGG